MLIYVAGMNFMRYLTCGTSVSNDLTILKDLTEG